MAVKQPFLTKNGPKTQKITRAKAIREKCLDCCGWFAPEVKLCPAKDCALWPYRMGKIWQENLQKG